MSTILANLDGVVCMIDDILIYGCNQEEHEKRLTAVLDKLHQAGVTLNNVSSQLIVFNFLVNR